MSVYLSMTASVRDFRTKHRYLESTLLHVILLAYNVESGSVY